MHLVTSVSALGDSITHQPQCQTPPIGTSELVRSADGSLRAGPFVLAIWAVLSSVAAELPVDAGFRGIAHDLFLRRAFRGRRLAALFIGIILAISLLIATPRFRQTDVTITSEIAFGTFESFANAFPVLVAMVLTIKVAIA